MELNESRESEFLVLEPVGHLDTRTANSFEKRIVELLGMNEKKFIVDLVSTEYISSAGLRVLLMLAKKVDGADGELILASLNDSVREVFEIAGFTGVFTIAANRAEAVKRSHSRPKGARIFNLAARLLAIKKFGPDTEAQPIDSATVRVSQRAADLLAIAEARDLAREAEEAAKS